METPATETTIEQPIAPVETVTEESYEDKIAALEAEKAKLAEEKENYRKAYLKETTRKTVSEDTDETDEERIRRITQETLADSRLADIAREQDEILKKALKENKELKLAQLNKTQGMPSATGTHTESQPVKDTLVTPEQLAYFKSKGWSDKTIEIYKANLRKKI